MKLFNQESVLKKGPEADPLFRANGANEFQSVFDGGVYVGKNTSQLANVRAQRVRCSKLQTPTT